MELSGILTVQATCVPSCIHEFVLLALLLHLVGVDQVARHFLGQLVEPAFVRPI